MPHILSITNAKGRIVSLLNDDYSEEKQNKRKYHCNALGCNKSFTTSGHLARHNRIHTGEKNFHCLHPGCPSKFSRQDNMMQHYKTHMSSRSRLHYYYHYHYPNASYKRPHEQHQSIFRREWSPASSSQSSYSSSSSSGSSSPAYSPMQQTYYPPTTHYWVHHEHLKPSYFEGCA